MKIKELIVVEGKSDTAAVKNAVDADTLETNGSAVDKPLIEKVRLAQKKRGVIIFTDPDYPGERIRKILSRNVPGCKHAFVTRKEAVAQHAGSLGVEHATPATIREALSKVQHDFGDDREIISWNDLIIAGLVGGQKARERREQLGNLLKIGYANGKQLHKRLMMFQITKEEFSAALRRILQEEKK
jgi:ribonuclease M5